MQKQIFIGNLTKDVEVKTLTITDKQITVATITVACNDRENETVFVPIEVWGKMAETCSKYLSKGKKVYVETEMRTNNYEKDGIKVYSYKFIAKPETIEFLSPATATTSTQTVPEPVKELKPKKTTKKKTETK